MKTFSTVLTAKKDYIGTITLNRPESLNTFNMQMAKDLNEALEEMEKDSDVRVVVVNAAGRGFCAGIDVNGLKGKSPCELYDWVSNMEKMSLTIANMGKPVITSVHGVAVANGIGLVASSDLAVVSKDARFGATAVKVGLFCMGPAVPLSRCLGRKKAMELLLTGDIIDADEAKRIGLVNQVVERDKLEEATLALAKKIAALSPLGVQMGKKSFYRAADLEYAKAFELVNNHFAMLCTTEDASEGVDAFLNKRKPEWKLR
ncbi:MAG: enoyl-CoA hydratase-related protein [Clostridia bacterium]|jgi:enoyl-CoA hydratase/carnithine racemase|nr:enoyl-CoA hydratase-related protein [Clostridia bacterium]